MDWILVLSSVTYALEAQELLEKHHIRSVITRSAAIRKVRGCGYGLRVGGPNRSRAETLLRDAGIQVLGTVEIRAGR